MKDIHLNNAELNRVKILILDWIVNTITDNFCTYVTGLEKKLCADNGSPNGFVFNNMHFKPGPYPNHFTCKPELEERAYEIWELKQKIYQDGLYLKAYFSKVLSKLTNSGQLYCYVPQFMHQKIDTVFPIFSKNMDDRRPIEGLEPDPEIFKLISFYVMTKLIT